MKNHFKHQLHSQNERIKRLLTVYKQGFHYDTYDNAILFSFSSKVHLECSTLYASSFHNMIRPCSNLGDEVCRLHLH